MAKVYDYKCVNGDLVIENGDFAKCESTLQHQANILIAKRGDFRNAPQVGVGIYSYINDDGSSRDEMLHDIQDQFETDGMRINEMKIGAAMKPMINAEYI